MNELYQKIETAGVVPVLAIEDAGCASALGAALIEGGLPVAEVTFRTSAAAEVIARLRREYPELLVGAGTVLTTEQVHRAFDAGASFAVAPGTNPRVVEEAQRVGLPFSPGVMTPSDIEAALELGVTVMKFFPAGAAGGVNMLKSLVAPYAHLGVRFIPTGGVSAENLRSYLEVKAVLAAGGTWIATREDVASGAWETVRERCRAARDLVRTLRGV